VPALESKAALGGMAASGGAKRPFGWISTSQKGQHRTCSAASSTVSSRRPYSPSERRAKVPVHAAPSHRQ
jgi:hypothetical protein